MDPFEELEHMEIRPPKIKPTLLQRKVFKNYLKNGGNMTKAIKDAGGSVDNRGHMVKRTGWKMLVEEYLADEDLAKTHREGLKATKHENVIGEKGTETIESPDFPTRHRYLESAYRLKNRYQEEGQGGNQIIIEITNYGENKTPTRVSAKRVSAADFAGDEHEEEGVTFVASESGEGCDDVEPDNNESGS